MRKAEILRLRDCFAWRSSHFAQDDKELAQDDKEQVPDDNGLEGANYFAAAAPPSTSANENASDTLGCSLPATST